jgi:hypothetical protein
MANISASARAKDTMLFCGAVIRNVRENKTFSFQSLYVEATGKRNPNKAYKLRDALIAVGVIKKHKDGSYSLTHQNFDSTKVVADVTEWLDAHKETVVKDEEPKGIPASELNDTIVGIEVLENFSDDVLADELKRRALKKHPNAVIEIKITYTL